MSRDLSSTAKSAIFASQTSEAFLMLVEISDDGSSSNLPIRVTSDNVTTTSNSNDYSPFPFLISMPAETEDRLPIVEFAIDNVDRSIIQEVRQAAVPLTVTLSVVLASSPDTIEAGPFVYTLRNVRYNAHTINGELLFEDILNEPYPAASYDPTNYPGLFQ